MGRLHLKRAWSNKSLEGAPFFSQFFVKGLMRPVEMNDAIWRDMMRFGETHGETLKSMVCFQVLSF